MLSALLITLREGLEAALVVGIIIGYLAKVGQTQRLHLVWAGVAAAAALSGLLALGITALGAELEGVAEQLFEGTTMLLAVAVLTWMIFWMQSQARFLKASLESEVQRALTQGAAWGLFGLSFLAVFREGVETALFLGAAAFQSNGLETLAGAVMGLALATGLGYLIYASTVRLNVRLFFRLTSLLLLVFAAGLFMHGVHEFQEAGLLPEIVAPLWDTSQWVSARSLAGQFLQTLVGYTPTPSLVEVLAYVGYWLLALLGVRWFVERRAAQMKTAQP